MQAKEIAALGVFAAAGAGIHAAEALLPPIVPIPGIKPGLANIITLMVLRRYSPRAAAMVLIVRIAIAALLSGNVSGLAYSLAGGILSFAVSAFVDRVLGRDGLWFAGVAGALAHNAGQLAVAVFIMGKGVLVYAPFLAVAGCITGLFTGLAATFASDKLSP